MKTIDRLIIKAKKKCGIDRLINAFIYPSEESLGKWIADGRIWDGIPRSGTLTVTCSCDSVDDAIHALSELSEKYPNNKDVPIFIDTLKE